jgi:hypothetical protein
MNKVVGKIGTREVIRGKDKDKGKIEFRRRK